MMNMRETLEKSKERWAALSVREKQAVLLGGSLLLIFLVYELMWSPALNHIQDMRKRIATDQKTLVWMQSADKTMQNAGNLSAMKMKAVSLVVFLGQIQDRVKQSGLESTLTQLKQSANESIEMHFQKVEFDKLISFLVATMKEHPVAISRFSVVATDAPGVVNADIVMKQG